MRQFTVGSQLSPNSAKALREELQKLGLIRAQVARTQGATDIYEIRLTPLGRKVAEHFLAIHDLLEKAQEG